MASNKYNLSGKRISGVAPGNILFAGSVWDKKLSDDAPAVKQMIEDCVPLKKLGNPLDIANLVLWLTSPLASFITGSVTVAGGG
jgi:3-oxoacyl-[acyl-carrier protein] reductase